MIIYMVKNNVNGKVYIGQTIETLPERRWQNHLSSIRCGIHKNTHLSSSVSRYGEESFSFSIIDSAESQEELDKLECHYINVYKTLNRKFGYNKRLGGRTGRLSAESIEKMRKTKTGRKLSSTHRENIRKSLLGHTRTKGVKWSKEAVEKRKKQFCRFIYTITSPSGEVYTRENINILSEEFGLDKGSVCRVANGKLSQTKGYKITKRLKDGV